MSQGLFSLECILPGMRTLLGTCSKRNQHETQACTASQATNSLCQQDSKQSCLHHRPIDFDKAQSMLKGVLLATGATWTFGDVRAGPLRLCSYWETPRQQEALFLIGDKKNQRETFQNDTIFGLCGPLSAGGSAFL